MLTFKSHIYHQDQSQRHHHHNRCSGLILWFFFAHSPIGALWLWNWVKAGRSCIYFCLYHSKKQNKKKFTRLVLRLSLSSTPPSILFDPLLCLHLKILKTSQKIEVFCIWTWFNQQTYIPVLHGMYIVQLWIYMYIFSVHRIARSRW